MRTTNPLFHRGEPSDEPSANAALNAVNPCDDPSSEPSEVDMRMSLIEDVLSREPSDEPWPCQNIRKLLHLSIPHAAPSRYSKDPVLTDERFEPRKLANHATAQFRSLSQPGHFAGQFSMALTAN